MNKISQFAVAAIFAVSYSVQADVDKAEYCATISKLSETVMTTRQRGISLNQMLEVTSEATAGDELAKQMILDAFDQPRFSTASLQVRTIEDFRDKWTLICHRTTFDN